MSIEALNWVLNEAPHANHSEFAVLIGLANHAHADGKNSFPAVSKIAKYASMSERTVQRVLRELEERGVIRRGNQAIVNALIANPRYRPTCYDLNMTVSGKFRGDTLSPLDDPGVTAGQLRGDKQVALGVTPCHPNQELNQTKTAAAVCDLSDQRLSDTKLTDKTAAAAAPPTDKPQATPHAQHHPETLPTLQQVAKAWGFGKRGVTHLMDAVSRALTAGHSASDLLPVLLEGRHGVRRPVAVLAARLDDLPEPRQKTPTITPKCDACNPSRWIEDPTTGHNIRKCPTCHPSHTHTYHQKAAA